MGNISDSKFLYHYTSVETLALILKNRTWRFNNLTDMDDLEEGISMDLDNIGRFVFVSSWTDSVEESIPLWNLYTPNMTGVRICMPKKFFELSFPNKDGEFEYFDYLDKYCSENYSSEVTILRMKKFLKQVEYTDNETLLRPEICREYESNGKKEYQIALNEVGKYKRTAWSFQREWRYSMAIVPILNQEFSIMREEEDLGRKSLINVLKTRNVFSYFDIPIEPKILSMMTILCGPKMSAANKIIVKSLVDTYNPTIKITYSQLKIR